MNIKKYIAVTSREALRQVKNELGEDAVILSNRKTANGVEIMALASTDMSNLATSSASSEEVHKIKESTSAFSQTLTSNSGQQKVADVPKSQIPDTLIYDIISEIKAMRDAMENQLATVAWGNFTQHNPVKTKIAAHPITRRV